MEPIKTITDPADLKDLPPGHYVIAGDAAAQMMEQYAQHLIARIEALEEETGVAEKRREKEYKEQVLESHTQLYLQYGFPGKEARYLAHADWRRGTSYDHAERAIQRKKKEQTEEVAREKERQENVLRLNCMRAIRRALSQKVVSLPEYRIALEEGYSPALIMECVRAAGGNVTDWGYKE